MNKVEKKLAAAQGPFLKIFHENLRKLNLKRCAYHGGALLGNDVHKLLQRHNFQRILLALKPQRHSVPGGAHETFGSLTDYQRAITLFSKLASVYKLATANRSLCEHEVVLLKVRCYSLGNFFPVNYPESSVKPKLHILAYHFAEKADLSGSVGIETEQLIEGMHPFINRRTRQFCSVRDPEQQLALVVQSQWVASGARMPTNL